MVVQAEEYRRAEHAFLSSEGVTAGEQEFELERLGGRVRVLVSGDGPPVLFIPGVMTSGAVFAGLVGRLPGLRCIMVDRPGTGLSSLTTVPPTDRASNERPSRCGFPPPHGLLDDDRLSASASCGRC